MLKTLISAIIGRKSAFSIWAFSDVHQGDNIGYLTRAVSDFNDKEWDIAVNLGDNVSPNGNDADHDDFIAEFSGLSNGHEIDDVYHIMGNSDATVKSDPNGANFYFQRYCDPFGLNTTYSGVTQRPYPITGTYDAYYFTVGNMLIIMISDRNDDDPPSGENGQDRADPDGRRAGGAWTTEQWTFLKNTVENNTDKIIIVGSHQAIKDTSLGSGWGEFVDAHHEGRTLKVDDLFDKDDVNEQYAFQKGYVGFIENTQGTINTTTGDSTVTDDIKTWLETNGQYIDLWLTAHFHRYIGESYNSKTRYAEVYGCKFLNITCINSHYGYYTYSNGVNGTPVEVESKSNLLSINGNNLNIKTYIHDDPYAVTPNGFYAAEEFNITLKTPLLI